MVRFLATPLMAATAAAAVFMACGSEEAETVVGTPTVGAVVTIDSPSAAATAEALRKVKAGDCELGPGAQCEGADFEGADLRPGTAAWQQFSPVDLSGSNLRYADLSEVSLFQGSLKGADLTGANLRGAQLRSVSLKNAILRDATLRTRTWRSPISAAPKPRAPSFAARSCPRARPTTPTAKRGRPLPYPWRTYLSTLLSPVSARYMSPRESTHRPCASRQCHRASTFPWSSRTLTWAGDPFSDLSQV